MYSTSAAELSWPELVDCLNHLRMWGGQGRANGRGEAGGGGGAWRCGEVERVLGRCRWCVFNLFVR